MIRFSLLLLACLSVGVPSAAATEAPDFRLRLAQVRVLADQNDPKHAEALRAALAEPVWAMRLAALRGLRQLGDDHERTIALAIDLLHCKHPDCASQAALLLAEIGHRPATPHLVAMLQAGDTRIRTAIDALTTLGDPSAADALIELYNDPEYRHGRLLQRPLAATGDRRAIRALLTRDERNRLPVHSVEMLVESGTNEATVEALIEVLAETEDQDARAIVVRALGGLGSPRAVEPLLALLGSDDPNVHIALGRIGGPAYDAALARLGHEDARMVADAARVLGLIGDRRATGALVDLLWRDEVQVVDAAARALADMRDPDAAPALLEKYQATAPQALASVVYALGAMQYRPAAPSLIEHLTPGSYSSIIALGQIGDTRAVEPLMKLLENQPRIDYTLTALGQLGSKEAEPAILKAMERLRDRGDAPLHILNALQALRTCGTEASVEPVARILADDRSHTARVTAAMTLGRIGHRSAVPALIQALEDRGSGVSTAAAEALGQIGDPRAVPALIKLVRERNNMPQFAAVIEALGRIDDRSIVPTLISNLDSDDSWLVEGSARVLGRMKAEGAFELLIDAAGHRQWNVRGGAALALADLGDARAVPQLLAMLEDDDRTAHSAVRALGRMDDPAARSRLRGLLWHEDGTLMAFAADALAQRPTPDLLDDARRLARLRLSGRQRPAAARLLEAIEQAMNANE
ncbi:MAG: HEAT repeat domain-containing protein [Phycisphaeraceae bacterium]|nr:HEAT repeat domain-containing protein [Phycisphaeraceae bacterium]